MGGSLSTLLLRCSFKTKLIYCENDLSSFSDKILIASIISASRVMLTLDFNGFISWIPFFLYNIALCLILN